MKERLRRFMKAENLNSTLLAQNLQIQASGISHILSGRNKPSYDFVTKLLTLYPNLNPDWLLLGKGTMYRLDSKDKKLAPAPSVEPTLDFHVNGNRDVATSSIEQEPEVSTNEPSGFSAESSASVPTSLPLEVMSLGTTPSNANRAVERIIILYRDGSFDTYTPALKK